MKGTIYILCIIALISAMAVPATAEYVAEHKKMSIYEQGAGDLVYTCGTPFYTCINTGENVTYNIDLDLDENVVDARLYVYWTWSLYDVEGTGSASDDVATYPVLGVEVNDVPVSFDYAPGTNWIDHYTDAKNIAAVGEHKYLPDGTVNLNYVSWNFPAGTNCSSVEACDLTLQGGNNVTVTNVHPYTGGFYNGAKVCIQGVGILLTLEDDNKMYWIAEGNDMTYVKWSTGTNTWSYGITPDNAITKVKFPGAVPSGMDTATLTSVVPAGGTSYNRLYFNALSEYWWDGLWNGVPNNNLAVSVTDVSAALRSRNNMARFQNGLWSAPLDTQRGDRQMNVANAFLVVE